MVLELEKFNEPMEITKKSHFLKQQKVYSYVAEHKKITRKETEALLNIGTTKAYRILKELSSAGKLHINGSGKNVYYTGG